MTDRSSRADVRNPLINLEAVQELNAFPPEVRAALRKVFDEAAKQSAAKAERALAKAKPPMYAYHAAWKVNWQHLKHAVKP